MLAAVILHRAHVAHDLPVHDHLAADVGRRLQEDRVHAHVGREARGLGLHDLRAAHLAARGGDERVEGHILALEGRDTIAVLPEDPAEGGGKQTLARVGHRPLQHQIQRHDSSSIPRRRASSSASFSSGSRTAVRYQPSPRPG